LSRETADYQPSNITFAHLPPHENRRLKKRDRCEAIAQRALADLDVWIGSMDEVDAPASRSVDAIAV
jgi:methylenetetrahydrofolate--tRNA-(uracil-5-)-methyltransferase